MNELQNAIAIEQLRGEFESLRAGVNSLSSNLCRQLNDDSNSTKQLVAECYTDQKVLVDVLDALIRYLLSQNMTEEEQQDIVDILNGFLNRP
jgi:hypothetical protein